MAELAHHLALGPLAQALGIALALAFVQAVYEQPRVPDHAFALGVRRALVVLEPRAQLARGQSLLLQAGQQTAGVFAVGARQRHEHARGRPARHARLAYRLQQLLGQSAQQHQAPLDPADVARALVRRFALRQTVGVDQLAQQHRLLDGDERARARACQHLCQRLADRAAPALHGRCVATQSPQRSHASVAVDEDQAEVLGLPDGHAFHQLTVLLDRIGQSLHRRRIRDAHGREAQIQAMQVQLHGRGP